MPSISDPRLSALPIVIENCQVDGKPIPPLENEYKVIDKPICLAHYGELMKQDIERNGGVIY